MQQANYKRSCLNLVGLFMLFLSSCSVLLLFQCKSESLKKKKSLIFFLFSFVFFCFLLFSFFLVFFLKHVFNDL